MIDLVLRFVRAESASATSKYSLIAAVLSAAIITAALGIATKLTASPSEGLPLP